MKALKILVAAMLVLGMTLGVAGCSDSDVAARVNGEVIKRSDLDAQIAALEEQYPDMFSGVDGEGALLEFQQRLLDNMIDVVLIEQAAEERGIEVSDSDVQAQIDDLKTGFADDAQFEEVLAQSGMTLEMLEEQVYDSLLTDAIVQSLTAEVEITDEDIAEYYEATESDWVEPAQVHAQHILFNLEDEDLAKDVLQQLQDGASFDAMAEQYSQDPGSAAEGGDLGWNSSDTYVPEFKEAVDALDEGEMSGLVESTFGWHIIKLLEKKDEVQQSLEDVSSQIEQILMQEASSEAFQQFLNEQRDAAEIEILMPELATPAVNTTDDE